jgi:hypothetical protein
MAGSGPVDESSNLSRATNVQSVFYTNFAEGGFAHFPFFSVSGFGETR